MKVRDLGEAALLARMEAILARVAPADPARVRVGIGDDAAVLAPAAAPALVTCDLLVEEVHFRRSTIAPRDLGHKALAVNLSDIAAMGGCPVAALLSLALPGDLPVAFVEEFYAGLAALAAATGVSVVGGDTAGSPGPVVIDVTVLGEVLPGGPFLASAARPGDLLYVTGHLGAGAAGLAVSGQAPETAARAVREAHVRPQPRLAAAAVLADWTAEQARTAQPDRTAQPAWRPDGRGRAARDTSDGLAVAALLLAGAGGCAIELAAGAIPIAPETRTVAAALGLDPLDLALYGGEDYELLFTATPEEAAELEARLPARAGTPVTRVGRVLEGAGVRLRHPDGRAEAVCRRGFDHFAPGDTGDTGDTGGGGAV